MIVKLVDLRAKIEREHEEVLRNMVAAYGEVLISAQNELTLHRCQEILVAKATMTNWGLLYLSSANHTTIAIGAVWAFLTFKTVASLYTGFSSIAGPIGNWFTGPSAKAALAKATAAAGGAGGAGAAGGIAGTVNSSRSGISDVALPLQLQTGQPVDRNVGLADTLAMAGPSSPAATAQQSGATVAEGETFISTFANAFREPVYRNPMAELHGASPSTSPSGTLNRAGDFKQALDVASAKAIETGHLEADIAGASQLRDQASGKVGLLTTLRDVLRGRTEENQLIRDASPDEKSAWQAALDTFNAADSTLG